MTTASPTSTMSRRRFLQFAGLVQGGVVLLAFVVGYLIDVDPRQLVRWEPLSLAWGLFAVGPMLVVYRWSPGLRTLAMEALGESLSRCRWIDLVVLAALAGVGEELLFRGVVYAGLARIDPWVALIGSNVAFGLLHALSRNYFLTTTAIGFAMHALAQATGERNLLAPMIAHGVYDLVAFQLLIREWRYLHSNRVSETSR